MIQECGLNLSNSGCGGGGGGAVINSCEQGKVPVFSVKGRAALNQLNNLKFSRILIRAVNYLNMLLLRIIT